MDIKYHIENKYMKWVLQINGFSGPRPRVRSSLSGRVRSGGATIVLYDDNVACIAQVKGGYIKGDLSKYISPKSFYTHELQNNGEIDVQQIRSSDNLADLFTNALSTATFKKLVYHIDMRQIKKSSK